MSEEGAGSVRLVEEYGPTWPSSPFERGTVGPRVILTGVDGSRTSMRAGAYAGGLANRQRARLMVVYITAPATWTAMTAGEAALAQEQAFDEVINEIRGLIRDRVQELEVPTTFVVRRGDAFHELRRAAIEARADMVVVGASEQAGHRLIGSIATRLVRAGQWPVTVVP
jgi:nucleotide-binding universal stress UspA family protein